MSNGQIVALVGVFVPSATALLVAYWHRKQMRQIEVYRLDPSVGLVPPPTRFWGFLKSYRSLLLGTGLPAFFLIAQLSIPGPPTRGTVALIALDVAFILFAFVMHIIGRLLTMIGRIVEVQAAHLEVTKAVVIPPKDRVTS